MEDIVLVERLKNQEPEALFYLYNEYRDRVFAVVRKVIRDEWDCEEVVQDVFWTVHRKIHLFREDSALWSWMYRIAINAAKMKARKYKRQPTPMDTDVLHDLQFHSLEYDELHDRPDHQLECQRLLETMQEYLDGMSQKNRQLYIDMELLGLPKEDVATKLELTVPAVKTRLHRLRAGLKDCLGEIVDQAALAPA